jgi:hypothetical protein
VQSWLTAGRSTKMPAGSGAGQSMGGLMPQIPHSCPTATEDASRAVAGRFARGRWDRGRSSDRSVADVRGPRTLQTRGHLVVAVVARI